MAVLQRLDQSPALLTGRTPDVVRMLRDVDGTDENGRTTAQRHKQRTDDNDGTDDGTDRGMAPPWGLSTPRAPK